MDKGITITIIIIMIIVIYNFNSVSMYSPRQFADCRHKLYLLG